MADLVHDNDYTDFDSKAYCDTFSSAVDLQGCEGLMTFIYDSLSRVFSSGKIQGWTLLDVGTGPSIHSVISAARNFPNVYLSDFCENNRNALWRWQTNHPERHDFSHYFKYINKKENDTELWQHRQDDMRSRIKGILSCDMTRDNPLFPAIFPQFDVISSCLCFDVVPSRSVSGYETAVKNVVSLLKPGGWFVLIGELNNHFYRFCQYKFDTVPLTREDVEGSFRKAGLTIDSWEQCDLTEAQIAANPYADTNAIFCMTAKKHSGKNNMA